MLTPLGAIPEHIDPLIHSWFWMLSEYTKFKKSKDGWKTKTYESDKTTDLP
jgi:hypothetical protein